MKIRGDSDRYVALPRVREGHRLCEPLRLVVDAARPNRIDMANVILGLRVLLRVAVYLAGGRQHEPGPTPVRELQSVFGPQ